MNIAGNWSNLGTFTSGTNTVTFDGSGDQTLTTGGTGVGQDFNNLTINKSGGTLSLSGSLDIDSTLTLTAGTLSQGLGNTITTINFTVNGVAVAYTVLAGDVGDNAAFATSLAAEVVIDLAAYNALATTTNPVTITAIAGNGANGGENRGE